MGFSDNSKRITIFCGHYGSGKTNLAINYAIDLKNNYDKVAIADLDIVNPYYRTKDAQKIIESKGIRMISSAYADSNVDVPAVPAEAYAITDDKSYRSVLDIGGDDRGAYALGRFANRILDENDYEMFFVINMYRPLTKDSKSTIEIMKEIENAAGIKFTAIINNSNLGAETLAEDVIHTFDYAKRVSEQSGLEIRYTSVLENIYGQINNNTDNAVPIKLYVKQSWIK